MTATSLKQTIVSNIRPQGLAPQAAAAKIAWLLNQMRVQQRSGVALKDLADQALPPTTPRAVQDEGAGC